MFKPGYAFAAAGTGSAAQLISPKGKRSHFDNSVLADLDKPKRHSVICF